jgi:hypothetical protein
MSEPVQELLAPPPMELRGVAAGSPALAGRNVTAPQSLLVPAIGFPLSKK